MSSVSKGIALPGLDDRSGAPADMPARRPGRPPADAAGQSNDILTLNDAVGIAGVDINAEEERMRVGGDTGYLTSGFPTMAPRQREFVNEHALSSAMQMVGSTHQIRAIHPEAVALMGSAVKDRLLSLSRSSLRARDHRLTANYLRAPPLVQKRGRENEHSDELQPAWGVNIEEPAPEAVLASIEAFDRDRERQWRMSRMQREAQDSARLHETRAATSETGQTPEEKKQKKKNSEAARFRSSDRTALLLSGARKYSWADAGAGAAATFSARPDSQTKAERQKKKDDVDKVAEIKEANWEEQEREMLLESRNKLVLSDVLWALDHQAQSAPPSRAAYKTRVLG